MTVKQPGEHLTHGIYTRWTAEEKAEVIRQAREAGVTVNTWLRTGRGFPPSNQRREAKGAE